jgi:antitoxin FitA
MTISIPLSEESAFRLSELAAKHELSSTEFLRQQIESWLQSRTDDFRSAAERVLEKNAELYRRLA